MMKTSARYPTLPPAKRRHDSRDGSKWASSYLRPFYVLDTKSRFSGGCETGECMFTTKLSRVPLAPSVPEDLL